VGPREKIFANAGVALEAEEGVVNISKSKLAPYIKQASPDMEPRERSEAFVRRAIFTL
jgi:CTP synthase (UTP-ammonia lyase)